MILRIKHKGGEKIKKELILAITLLFILVTINTAAATNTTDQNNISSLNNTITNITSTNSTSDTVNQTNMPNTVISGQVTQCQGEEPFSGATVNIESLTGLLLATATTDSNGQYSVSFYSAENSFKVTAAAPGHVMPTKIVTVNPAANDSVRYGIADFKLGTLQLTKGSWDIITLDNKVNNGPNQYLIQIHVTNTASTTATNVVSTLNFTTANSYVNLAPNETNIKNLGDIAPGATVDIFYLIEITRNTAAFDTTRNYTITLTGDNTGSPADTITGQLYVQKFIDQSRNSIVSITTNNTDPILGDTISVTMVSSTSASNYNIINLPLIYYNSAILQPISMTTTYNSNTINDIKIDNPGTNSFTSVWVYKVIGTGVTSLFGLITDLSGGSYHYNSDFGTSITITAHSASDLVISKTAPTTVVAGQTISYTITVTNNGPSSILPTDTFTVTDSLPSGFTASSYTPSAGIYNPVTGAWTGVTLASGQSITLTITGTVSPSATGTLNNTATVAPPSGVIDPNSGNNQATTSTTINRQTDLVITKTGTPNPVIAGQTLTYKITVTNNGPSSILPTDTFTVIDSLPSGFTASSYAPSVGAYNPVTGAWTGVTLASGQSVTLTITGTVSPTATGILSNTATVAPPASVNDPNLGNNPAITSTTVDALPVANDDNKTTPEDTPLSGNLPASDPDGPIALVSFTISGTTYAPGTNVNIPGVGTIVVNSNGSYTFIPAPNYNGPVPQIHYTVRDNTGNMASANLNINVTPVNDAPVARNDSTTTNEDTPATISVLSNDSDVDGDTLTVTSTTSPTHGTVFINANGTITYTPNTNYSGSDSFTYTISDGKGGTATATVSINVIPVNDAPMAVNDAATVFEDGSVNIPVMNNDSDADGDTLTVIGTTSPAHGTVVINVDGTVTYTPNANYNGPDSFTYTISDGNGGTSTATVNVNVTPLNDVPVANGDSKTIPEDTQANGQVTGSDIDGDALTFTLGTGPVHGTVTMNANGTYTYAPNANYNGLDQFTVVVSDGNGGTATVTVLITVTPVNDAPVARNDSTTTNEDTPATISVLSNDSDVDGDTLTVTSTTSPTHGTVFINADGTVTYTPNANYNGSDSFTYTISDGNGGTSTATVNVNVTSVNDVPVANNDNVATNEDVTVSGNAATNDLPSDDGGNVWSIVTGPAHGLMTMNSDGTYTYTPNANYNGQDSFTYQIMDANGDISQAIVSINVTPVNDAPIANNDSTTTNEDTSVTISVLNNDSDVDGDTLTVTSVTQPTHGTVTVNANGTITYTPNANYNGPDSFTYTISDGNGGTATATVNVNIVPVNDTPIAVNDNMNTSEDTAVTISVTTNDIDIDGDTLTTIDTTNPTHGTVVINADGTVTYTPDANYNGSDSFTYTISDGNGGTSTATVNVNVTSVNDVPVANNDNVTTNEGTTVHGNVATNDLPSSDGGNIWSIITGPIYGSVTMNSDGTYTYTPDASYNGQDSFTYQIRDVDSDISQATVNITLNPVKDVSNLSITKKADKNKASIGDIVHFTIVVQNYGPDTAVSTKVTELMPSGLHFESYMASIGSYNPETGIWTIGDLPNGATATLTITSTIKSYGSLINRVNVTSLCYDPILDDNSAISEIEVTRQTKNSTIVNATIVNTKTISMQPTGVPLIWMFLAVLMILGGFVTGKRE